MEYAFRKPSNGLKGDRKSSFIGLKAIKSIAGDGILVASPWRLL